MKAPDLVGWRQCRRRGPSATRWWPGRNAGGVQAPACPTHSLARQPSEGLAGILARDVAGDGELATADAMETHGQLASDLVEDSAGSPAPSRRVRAMIP